ncbi:MAG: reverse transcriptase/maturase family protein, partial [Candidatus Falkowbacteria bacterium]|nr:reverse transcriptase/maturase family protein [Candidatus Falkowbacteria bacterium]
MKTELEVTYQEIISSGNLLLAWQEFVVGKRAKKDVIEFSLNLADNILQLHGDLANHNYRHGPYKDFFVTDPKLRHIHKAAVSDRLVHHALYRQLYPYFAKKFIAHSYSCQLDKGTHRAIIAFSQVAAKVSHNDRRTAWVLQADIRKFFASIDHKVLLEIMSKYILDKNIIRLLKNIIDSFGHDDGRGLPLGNLTSQLLVNIYMNEFDKFIKYKLKIKYYLRYADDFVFLAPDKDYLSVLLPLIKTFLNK